MPPLSPEFLTCVAVTWQLGTWGAHWADPPALTPRSPVLVSSPLLAFSPESSFPFLAETQPSSHGPSGSSFGGPWAALRVIQEPVCAHTYALGSAVPPWACVWALGAVRCAWVLSLPSSADPDRGGLECGDVPWDRITRWSQQGHVLVCVLHCPDAVWELYPLWAGRGASWVPLLLTHCGGVGREDSGKDMGFEPEGSCLFCFHFNLN